VSTCFLLSPLDGQMHKGYTLLLGGETVEEIFERHLGIFVSGLGAGAVITDFFTLDGDRSAVRRFGEGQHIVIRKADPLADLIGDGNASSFAKDTV